MPERVDCVVAGAGAVGLAVARALALSGREVLVVEREPAIGKRQPSLAASSRQSVCCAVCAAERKAGRQAAGGKFVP